MGRRWKIRCDGGLARCVSKVDKHVDDVDKWWEIMRCGDYLQPENGGIV